MKHTTLLAVLALCIACNPKSKVSSSSVETPADSVSQSALEFKKTGQRQVGRECALTTQNGNKYIFITGASSGKEIKLHDLEGQEYLLTAEMNGRVLPIFTDVEDKKGFITSSGVEENLAISYDEIDSNDNPDKMKQGMIITAINYRLNLPKTSDGVGEIQRAYTYSKSRGIFKGRTGKWKNIANIADCKGTSDYSARLK